MDRKSILKQLYPLLIVLGIGFLMGCLMVPIAQRYATNAQTNAFVGLQEQENDAWGQIPGSLKYNYQRTYRFYNLSTDSLVPGKPSNDISAQLTDAAMFNVYREYQNRSYSPQLDTVTFNTSEAIMGGGSDKIMSETIHSLNVGALSMWQQMNNKEDFQLVFKAIAQMRTIVQSQLRSRLVALNAFYYMFNDKDLVMSGVLAGLKNAEDIYKDENFGMDSHVKLYYWVKAASGGQEAPEYQSVQAHFGLTDEQMYQIVGPTSMLNMVLNMVTHNLMKQYKLHFIRDVDPQLFIEQWATVSPS